MYMVISLFGWISKGKRANLSKVGVLLCDQTFIKSRISSVLIVPAIIDLTIQGKSIYQVTSVGLVLLLMQIIQISKERAPSSMVNFMAFVCHFSFEI